MSQNQVETKQGSQVSVFNLSIASENGSGVYLLFVDQRPPAKHDLLVTDYCGTFHRAEDAMDWYDKRYLPYGEPQALIAKYNGDTMCVKLRSIVLGDKEDHVPGHMAWTYAFDDKEQDEDGE